MQVIQRSGPILKEVVGESSGAEESFLRFCAVSILRCIYVDVYIVIVSF